MEYQAKELFAKHDVPVTLGTVDREAGGRRRRRRAAGWPGRRQGTGQGRRSRQGRRREARREPRGSGREGHRHPRHGHQGPHRAPGADRADGRHRRRVLLLLPGRPRQPRLPLHRQRRGRCRDRGGRAHQPGRDRPRLDRPAGRRRRRQGRRDRLRVALPGRGRRGGDGRREEAVGRVHQGGRVAGRGEPARAARPTGHLEALDGKVTLDENADFRHEDHDKFEDKVAADPLEAKAKAKGLNYVKLDGAVGIIGNGAGLVMSTLDVVAYAGEEHGGVKPANFLDIGGGASAEVMANGLDVILNDDQVKSVFVNVFGGITACDAVANGIVHALEILGDEANKPLVVRLDGNNVDEGRRILDEADHPLVTLVETMDGAADKAAELASKAGA